MAGWSGVECDREIKSLAIKRKRHSIISVPLRANQCRSLFWENWGIFRKRFPNRPWFQAWFDYLISAFSFVWSIFLTFLQLRSFGLSLLDNLCSLSLRSASVRTIWTARRQFRASVMALKQIETKTNWKDTLTHALNQSLHWIALVYLTLHAVKAYFIIVSRLIYSEWKLFGCLSIS